MNGYWVNCYLNGSASDNQHLKDLHIKGTALNRLKNEMEGYNMPRQYNTPARQAMAKLYSADKEAYAALKSDPDVAAALELVKAKEEGRYTAPQVSRPVSASVPVAPVTKKEEGNNNVFKINTTPSTGNLSEKIIGGMLKRSNSVIDLATGLAGIRTAEGIATFKDDVLSVNPVELFTAEVPAFAFPTKPADVKVGDIYVNAEGVSVGWVVSTGERGEALRVVDTSGSETAIRPVKNALTGNAGVFIVRPLFDLGGGDSANPLASVLPLIALSGGDGLEGDKIGLLIAMSMMNGGGASGLSNMLPMLLLSGRGGASGAGGIDPIALMALSGGLGANAAGDGLNPFSNPMMMLALSGGLKF